MFSLTAAHLLMGGCVVMFSNLVVLLNIQLVEFLTGLIKIRIEILESGFFML